MGISRDMAVLVDHDPAAIDAAVSEMELRLTLSNGRLLSTPLSRFPRLLDATEAQRSHWRLIGRGHGIHWPDLDEDVSVRALLGRPS